MTLWTLLQGVILFVNGLAILNNERFLERYGWGFSQMQRGGGSGFGDRPAAFKQQVVGLLHAVAYLQVPLIACNLLIIAVKLVFG